MLHSFHRLPERSRSWLKVTGLMVALGLHAGAFAFLVYSSEPKMVGEPAQEEIIGVSLLEFNEQEESADAQELAEEITEEVIVEEPEPEPVVEDPVLPEPIVEKPKPKPKPIPKPQPKIETKVAEVAKPATAPKKTEKQTVPGGQQAKTIDPNTPRVISQVNYQGAPPRPVYPRASQRRNEQGRAIVRVLITTQGTVGEVWIKSSSGHDRLDKAALDAVRKVKFKPYTENGVAYRAMADIPFDFVL